jgi:hypothetical protein
MDVSDTQPSRKASDPAVYPGHPADDRKEVAWAFLGLLLWSGVVLGGLFGVGYVVGHSIFRLW